MVGMFLLSGLMLLWECYGSLFLGVCWFLVFGVPVSLVCLVWIGLLLDEGRLKNVSMKVVSDYSVLECWSCWMELVNRFLPECVVVDIADDKFGYPKTLVLKSHVSKLLMEGHRHIVLNLAQVEMLDSFGLAVLISLLKICKELQGNLTLFGLNTQPAHLIELTHMDRVLDIWESEGQAIRQVRVSRP